MHACALGIYTYLVFQGLINNEPFFNAWIFLSFLCVFILKILGVIVHIPAVEQDEKQHNFFWIIIAILVIGLNTVTLLAINAGSVLLAAGIAITIILVIFYIRSLFTSTGEFYLIAGAMAIVHILCAAATEGILRTAWVCLLLSSLLWIVLSRVPYLLRYKYHNDIYHLALIASTYLLYRTISTGLWE